MKKALSVLIAVIICLTLFTACKPKNAGFATGDEAPAVLNTVILKEQDDSMINTYTVIAVDENAPFTDSNGEPLEAGSVAVNTEGADALIKWLLSEEGLTMATEFGMVEYGDTLFYLLDGVPKYEGEIAVATAETETIRLSTTTSVNDSGLLDELLRLFEQKYGYTVEVQSAGTGKAIAAAKYGNADLILVHSKSQETAFVEDGFARVVDGFSAERISFLYNFFVLCGPSDDPAGAKDAEAVKDAFKSIADGKFAFISRGDGSGTHTKEISLWPEELAITAEAESFADYTDWYISANTGMGACLVMAEETSAYILTDKATFLTFVANGGIID